MTQKFTFPISVRSVKEKGEHIRWLAKQPQLNIEAEGDLIEETFKECVKKVRTQIETFHIGGRLVFRDEYVLSEGVASQYYGGILSTCEDFIKLNGTLYVTVRQDASLDQFAQAAEDFDIEVQFGDEPPIKCDCDEPCETCTCQADDSNPISIYDYVFVTVPEAEHEMGVWQVLEDLGQTYKLSRVHPKQLAAPYDLSVYQNTREIVKSRVEPIPEIMCRPKKDSCLVKKCAYLQRREISGLWECTLCELLPSNALFCPDEYNKLLHTQMRIIESNRQYAESPTEEESA